MQDDDDMNFDFLTTEVFYSQEQNSQVKVILLYKYHVHCFCLDIIAMPTLIHSIPARGNLTMVCWGPEKIEYLMT